MILLIRTLGGFSFSETGAHCKGPRPVGYAALWAVAFLPVGFFEEYLFRGYTQFTLATGLWILACSLDIIRDVRCAPPRQQRRG